MNVLDNANMIAQRDPQGALSLAAESPAQLRHSFSIAPIEFEQSIASVVFSGMGGSALQAELCRTWPQLDVPFIISKQYELPSFVDERTLVIVSSYSGNTEETLSALDDALRRHAQIVVMTGGGQLLERAKQEDLPHVVIPEAPQPRMAVLYGYRALVEIFVACGLVETHVLDTITQVSERLENAVSGWTKDVVTEQNYAKQLALELMGKTPIFHAGPLMYPAAYKWKIGANENAKNTAWTAQLPEFNHNEFIGWSSHPIEKPFAVVDLRSSFEHERVQKRFEVSDRLLSGMRPKATVVEAKGDTIIEQLLYLVVLGDFVTLYLSLLNGVNPSPVELVEKFKKELNA